MAIGVNPLASKAEGRGGNVKQLGLIFGCTSGSVIAATWPRTSDL